MKTVRWMIVGAVAAALAGCGAEEIASPGSGGNITINPPDTQTPTDPTVNVQDPAVPLGGCPGFADPAGLTDGGTIKGPTGEYRVCVLPARITRSAVLERVPGVLYALNGRTDVGYDCGPTPGQVAECKLTAGATTDNAAVTLTINAGVIVFAKTGTSWLAVNRGNKLIAAGDATHPIVFTSQDNVLGLATDNSQGKWGGIVLMGRAPVTDCTGGSPGTELCWRDTEGATAQALFGGATPTDNSGTLNYVQIRYSGFILSANTELQSLTLEGTGSGTTVQHIHSHNSSDDGIEIFGGRTSLRHFVVTGADDDSFDADTGWKGTIQYAIAVHKTAFGDSMIELDSANGLEAQTPRTSLKMANFTFVSKGANGNNVAMMMRGGADASLVNGVVVAPTTLPCLQFNNSGLAVTAAADATADKAGPPVFRSVVMQCSSTRPFVGSGGASDQLVQDTFMGGGTVNNSFTFTPSLASVFINGSSEGAVVATDPTTIDAAFDPTVYVGAVQGAADTWYQGWTCNSATANFLANPPTRSLCSSLPSLLN